MVSTVEHAGVQEAVEKDAVAPVGRPEMLKETVWLLPVLRLAEIEFVTDEPATTDLFPEFANKKLNGWVTVNEALASGLGLMPLLNALALTVALLVTAMGPVYSVEDWVGVNPLTV